jgi:LysM repeat protein
MTRENKLALVVGFGLILFVGILISDHFSTVRTQRPADLTTSAVSIDESYASGRGSEPNLIEILPFATPTPALNTGTLSPSNSIVDPTRPEHVNNVLPGALPGTAENGDDVRILAAGNTPTPSSPPGFVPVPNEPDAIPVKLHEIRDGETLYAICRKYYGDVSRVNALAKYNDLTDPAALASGYKLQIPPVEAIGGKPVEPKVTKTKVQPAPSNSPALRIVQETKAPSKALTSVKTYTVRSGDSLARIASKHYGSKAKWKKIYDMNRDVIEDPDNVKPGTVLKLL